jgi:ribosome-associated heat shock protein Hsp15
MADRIRIDRWLWFARFYRTRALAQEAATAGLIRANGQRVEKPSFAVGPGDILTLPRGRDVVAIRILALALRRGPAADARRLYETVAETALDRPRASP